MIIGEKFTVNEDGLTGVRSFMLSLRSIGEVNIDMVLMSPEVFKEYRWKNIDKAVENGLVSERV